MLKNSILFCSIFTFTLSLVGCQSKNQALRQDMAVSRLIEKENCELVFKDLPKNYPYRILKCPYGEYVVNYYGEVRRLKIFMKGLTKQQQFTATEEN
jgi:hypothetical protein